MRPILSTRLFSGTCCSADALGLARAAGFPTLELDSRSIGGDLLADGKAERLAGVLAAEGTRAAWLRIGPDVTRRLGDPALLHRFGDIVGRMRLEGVTLAEPLPDADLRELLTQVELGGARLCLEREGFTRAELRRWPRAVELSWDLSAASAAGSGPGELDRFLGELPAGRLLVVRVAARDEAGRRVPPREPEAILLEETWRRARPEYVVYDVEDPSGFGAATSLDRVLAELRAFHTGATHPHEPGPWGLFGSA